MSEQGEQQWHYSTALQQKKTSLNWCFSSSPNRKIVCNQTTSHALSINFLFVWRMWSTSADRTIRVLISIFKHKRHESRALYPISGPSESGGNSPYLRILAELEAKTATCQLWFDAIRNDYVMQVHSMYIGCWTTTMWRSSKEKLKILQNRVKVVTNG